jgi:hypothetical protein
MVGKTGLFLSLSLSLLPVCDESPEPSSFITKYKVYCKTL